MKETKRVIYLLVISLIIGCSAEDGSDGLDGIDGVNGTDGIDGLNSLVITLIEQPGENCPNGGFQIQSGIDTNSNGQLDESEFDNIEFICNGQNAELGFTRYVSLISQSGTDDPTSNVLENTLGLEIDWVRESEGRYLGTLSSTIDLNNTVIFHSTPSSQVQNHTGVRGVIESDTEISLELQFGIGALRDNFNNLSFELRQYE
ncbi:DUF7151 family protein [Maribacter forsetii]|uniref:DUF7151 family protein n=1 Tax=Maribacter forsetii TaxID=444515 RepID=UPI00055B7357|nr:hypothetical protein [Maribacter forsetii]